jgi:hypothetical protein
MTALWACPYRLLWAWLRRALWDDNPAAEPAEPALIGIPEPQSLTDYFHR